MNQKPKVPSFLTKRPANNKKNNNETVLHDHAASRLIKTKIDDSQIQYSSALGATSRVILELKPFGKWIRGPIGSEPWVGRNTGKMSGSSSVQWHFRNAEIQNQAY